MHVPLVIEHGCGLHMTEHVIRMAHVTLLAGRLLDIQLYEEDAHAGIAHALKRLRSHLPARAIYAGSHLPMRHTRHYFLQGPPFDDEEEVEAWLSSHMQEHTPGSAFCSESYVTHMAEEETRAIIAVTREDALLHTRALLEEAGFVPVTLGSLVAESATAMAYSERFMEGTRSMAFDGCEVTYQGGMPISCEASGALPSTERWTLDMPTIGKAKEVPMAYMPATSFALKACLPALDMVNFLGTEAGVARDKKEALSLIYMASGAALAAIALVLALSLIMGHLEEGASDAGLARQAQARAVEVVEARTEAMRLRLARSKELVITSARAARLLSALGRSAPDAGLWLESIRASGDEATIIGTSADYEEVFAYVDSLSALNAHIQSTRVGPGRQIAFEVSVSW